MLERGRIGDPLTASYGRTRSFRNDYLDATYARLAHEAFRLWGEFERRDRHRRARPLRLPEHRQALASRPTSTRTYAQLSHETLTRLGPARRSRSTRDGAAPALPLPRRRPRRTSTSDAGVVDLPAVTPRADARRSPSAASGRSRASRRRAIARDGDGAPRRPPTPASSRRASLVVTAGHGTNDVLARLPGCTLQVPITKDRPSEAKYFVPPAGRARPLHRGRDAGDRLPRRRDLLPPDRRRARRRGEDRLLQPARPAARRDDASTASRASSSSACPGCATRRSATSRTSTSATTTSWPTTTSCSAPIPGVGERVRRRRLARHRLQVRALGRARARRARARRAAPSTTSPASTRPASTEGGAHR